MSASEDKSRTLKVIGLGLGRTGTLSFSSALEILGFGPCHHAYMVTPEAMKWDKLARAAKEKDPTLIDDIFHGYGSALDSPTAMMADALYKMYPNAKFILTVRDPTEWAQSIKKTLYQSLLGGVERESRVASGAASDQERMIHEMWEQSGLLEWIKFYFLEYLRGRVEIDAEGEFLRHNKYIMDLVPADKLLVYNVSEGWDPLVKFLGVPKPDVPFPHLNDSKDFERRRANLRKEMLSQGPENEERK